MSAYRLIIDIATNRIIYFTDDADKELFTDDYSALVSYNGELPAELSISNSWLYRFSNQQIVKPPANPNAKSLLDKNKASIKTMIQQRIAAKLNEFTWAEMAFNEQALSETSLVKADPLAATPALQVIMVERGLATIADAANYARSNLTGSAAKVLAIRALKARLMAALVLASTTPDVFAIRDELIEGLKSW